MELIPGSTSIIKHVFLSDSASPVGAGKTGLAYGDMTAYYVRAGGTLTQLTMQTIATLGTWANPGGDNYLGFKKVDDTNFPGMYELDLPNNILAAGANQVTLQLRAAGIVPCNLEIALTGTPAPDNTNIGLIKAKTDNLPADPASNTQVNTRMATFSYAAPDNASITAIKTKTDNLPASPAAVGDIPSATTIAAAVLAAVVEGAVTVRIACRRLLAAVAGKADGGGTATQHFRDSDDTRIRITATTDANGNRTAVNFDDAD